jgi:hypothetical protein
MVYETQAKPAIKLHEFEIIINGFRRNYTMANQISLIDKIEKENKRLIIKIFFLFIQKIKE